MNDQDFILLLEQYLDGSISPDGRRALREAVEADPERRRLFETHTREHVKLHAQTTRVDFTESQRVALTVIDVAEKSHETRFADLLREQTLRERWQAVLKGLRAPRQSAANRYARFALLRLFGPTGFSILINVAIILLVLFYALPPPEPPVTSGGGSFIDLRQPDNREKPTREPPEPPTSPTHGETTESPSGAVPPPRSGEAGLGEDLTPVHTSQEDGSRLPEFTAYLLPRGPAFTPLRGSNDPAGLPADLSGRSPEGRRKGLTDNCGTTNTEKAVGNALSWLKAHQSADGSWPGQEPPAMTGLALLAFLAHGELPSSPEYGPTVRAALDYLLAHQEVSGAFSKNAYAHAIATYSVCEAYTLTRVVGLRDPMNRAVGLIVAGQQADGGFDYDYKLDSGRFDTSVSGWQIQALKAARLAGVDRTLVDPALERSSRFLKTQAFARDGSGFVYSGTPGTAPASGATWTMTAVGTLCLEMLQESKAPQTRAGLKALEKTDLVWPAGDKAPVYGGYYLTQAKFQQGNRLAWKRWNEAFQRTLLRHQQADGHWEGGDYDKGSHVYTTALCTLMMEVYYRYLPTYGTATNNLQTAASNAGAVDVIVR